MAIVFAPQDRVGANPVLRDDFIDRVLELEWALVSDESSLWDFTDERQLAPLFAKIHEIYGVDVSNVVSGNLADIFERIASTRH